VGREEGEVAACGGGELLEGEGRKLGGKGFVAGGGWGVGRRGRGMVLTRSQRASHSSSSRPGSTMDGDGSMAATAEGPTYTGKIDRFFALEAEAGQDLVLHSILARLVSPKDLCNAASVCRRWRGIASSAALWDVHCARVWQGKVEVPEACKSLRASGYPRSALAASVRDSRRTVLTAEELTGVVWCFRFKADAGEDWQLIDPYWLGRPARRMVFAPDGRLLRSGDYFASQGQPLDPADKEDTEFMEDFAFPDLRWEFRPDAKMRKSMRSGDLHPGPLQSGSRLSVLVNGRRVPLLHISRHPVNWGFIMESCWTLYTKFDMGLRRNPDPWLEDENRPINIITQDREALVYNLMFDETTTEEEGSEDEVNGEEDFSEEEDNGEDGVGYESGEDENVIGAR